MGSEESWLPANFVHKPSTSDKVLTVVMASSGSIPSFIARTIYTRMHAHKKTKKIEFPLDNNNIMHSAKPRARVVTQVLKILESHVCRKPKYNLHEPMNK